jgi:ATP-dependent Clp protease ATP-binding subunit ClpC
MLEDYSERARRTLFLARYEASQFGSPDIETEHLLLGLLRDTALIRRLLPADDADGSIRKRIEASTAIREKVSAETDIPLSNECKRILTYAVEEADQLAQRPIGTGHLVLGLLREETCFAAKMLHEHGVRLSEVRGELKRVPEDSQQADTTPRTKIADLQNRIDFIVRKIEMANASHESEKALFYSHEERKARESLRLLQRKYDLNGDPES